MKKIVLLIFLILTSFSCKKENIPYEKVQVSEQEILKEINDSTLHNVVGKDILISDEETAISVAEPILFKNYGKEIIMKERPYTIGKAGKFWVISGTLESDALGRMTVGGVFEIVLNSENGEVVKLTHGK